PVVAGGLHADNGDLVAGQPVPQLQQPDRGGGEGADPPYPPGVLDRCPHARLEVGLTDVQTCAPLHERIHDPHRSSSRTGRPAPGDRQANKRLSRVLKATVHSAWARSQRPAVKRAHSTTDPRRHRTRPPPNFQPSTAVPPEHIPLSTQRCN